MSQRVSRKEGVGKRRRRPLPARRRETCRSFAMQNKRLATGRHYSDVCRTDQRCWPEPAPPTAASLLGIEPLDRRHLVSKALNVDAMLASYQFDVLVGDAQLLGITQEGDLM